MKKLNNFAVTMFMSISAAIGFTACSDDLNALGQVADNNDMTTVSANAPALEPLGLSYQEFITPNDVQILNADTTLISVSVELAEKLGIKSFLNHPMGIWQSLRERPYLRRAVGEKIENGRYILNVIPATVAEITNGKQFKLETQAYVNNNVTRSGEPGSFADKYVDSEGTLHPVAVMYHHNAHYGDESGVTRSVSEDQNVDVYTAEQLVAAGKGMQTNATRGFVEGDLIDYKTNGTLIDKKTKLEKEMKFECSEGDSIKINFEAPVEFQLNYTFILDCGHEYVVVPNLHEFEASVNGRFYFAPQVTIGFEKSLELDEDDGNINLFQFDAVTFIFTIGPVPFTIDIQPSIDLQFKAKVSGSVYTGIQYEYERLFKVGIRYDENYPGNDKWRGICEGTTKKNDISFITPRAEFGAEASVGLFFGVSVIVDKLVGPKLAIGPELGAEAKLTIAPWEEEPIDFSAALKVGLYARAGAKLEVFGWEIAEWTTEFNILKPIVLWQYPNNNGDDPKKYDTTNNLINSMNEEAVQKAMYEYYSKDAEMQSYMTKEGNNVYQAFKAAYEQFKKEMFCTPNVKNAAHMNTMLQMTKSYLRQMQNQTDTKQNTNMQKIRQQAIKEFRNRYGRAPRIDKATKKYVADDETKIQAIIEELKG